MESKDKKLITWALAVLFLVWVAISTNNATKNSENNVNYSTAATEDESKDIEKIAFEYGYNQALMDFTKGGHDDVALQNKVDHQLTQIKMAIDRAENKDAMFTLTSDARNAGYQSVIDFMKKSQGE